MVHEPYSSECQDSAITCCFCKETAERGMNFPLVQKWVLQIWLPMDQSGELQNENAYAWNTGSPLLELKISVGKWDIS